MAPFCPIWQPCHCTKKSRNKWNVTYTGTSAVYTARYQLSPRVRRHDTQAGRRSVHTPDEHDYACWCRTLDHTDPTPTTLELNDQTSPSHRNCAAGRPTVQYTLKGNCTAKAPKRYWISTKLLFDTTLSIPFTDTGNLLSRSDLEFSLTQ